MRFADLRPQWEGKMALDGEARTLRCVRNILRRNNPAAFLPEVDTRIRGEFTGLVAGDAPRWKG